jgi:hypothetical protein
MQVNNEAGQHESTLAHLSPSAVPIAHARPHGVQLPAATGEGSVMAVRKKTQEKLGRLFAKMALDPKLRPALQKVIVDAKRPHKYGAKAVTIDGIRFASTKEGKRYAELKLLAKAGEINSLTLQPEFDFKVNGKKIFTYVADFSYFDRKDREIIEDVKGVRTPVYLLKKKLIESYHDIEITEI